MSDTYEEARAAEAVLDRYRGQRQKDLAKYAAELIGNRDSYMLRARWAKERGKDENARLFAAKARDYNALAVRMRREVRGLEAS